MPKALIGMMALGGISLLVGFVLVIQQGHPASAKPEVGASTMANEAAIAPNPSASAIANQALTPALSSSSAALAPPSPTADAARALSEHPPLQVLNSAATVVDDRDAGAPEEPPVIRAQASEAAPQPKTQRAAKDSKVDAPTPRAKTERKPASNGKRDEDVALLEAMFTHAGPRQAPVSAAEDIRKRCGGMTGSEASVCRAKVCAQHPKSQLCRD